jgi:hypothetical protein
VVFTGLVAAPSPPILDSEDSEITQYQKDPRLARLREFLRDRSSPLTSHALHFLVAADRNHLDWRLLPSISVVESGAGHFSRNNNVFGWDSCNRSFPSIPNGIHTVARYLANSRLYKDKNLEGKLRTYNGNVAYPTRVQSVMRTLGPAKLSADSPETRSPGTATRRG